MEQKRIEQEVEKTMAILDADQHEKATPFFYTRLHARMNEKQTSMWELTPFFSVKMRFAVIALVMFVLVNAYSLFHLSSITQENSREAELYSFAQEYNVTTTSNY
jgi:hypothetical protein